MKYGLTDSNDAIMNSRTVGRPNLQIKPKKKTRPFEHLRGAWQILLLLQYLLAEKNANRIATFVSTIRGKTRLQIIFFMIPGS